MTTGTQGSGNRPPPAPQVSGDATGGVIPYKNVPALIAYYLGIFSVIPFPFVGIAAFILGIMGLNKASRQPQVRGRVHAWIGIIVGGLFGLLWTGLFVLGIVGMFAAS